MRSLITRLQYSWLAAPAPPLEREQFTEDTLMAPMPFPEEAGNVWCSSFNLPLRMVFRRTTHRFTPGVAGAVLPIAHVSEQMAEPVLKVQILKAGRVLFSDRRVSSDIDLGARQCIFWRTDNYDHTVHLDTAEDFDVYQVIIGDSTLRELLGEEFCEVLLRRMGVAAAPAVARHSLPLRIISPLYDCQPQRFDKLYAQSRILEFLYRLAEYCSASPENGGRQTNDPTMARLHDELLRSPGKAPTLTELAKRYGMSARALHERFREAHGLSIFACLSEARLAEAHEALLKTDTPIKAIAARSGYAHVSNFTIAFSNKYGYPPGKLRKES